MASSDSLRKAAPLVRESLQKLASNIRLALRGKEAVIDQVVIGLLAGGHLLLEDLPGLGKTTLAYALAKSIEGRFSRIQFTSDLLPGDVTGVSIFDEKRRDFQFKPGPIFANIVLADEINRATPKTQSALLEVMDRAQVTIDGISHPVGNPFLVIATQNPVDYEGTFPLPESQMDRFFLRLQIGYPEAVHEREILRSSSPRYESLDLKPVLSATEVLSLQALVRQVHLEEAVLDYALALVRATRTEAAFKAGISVRGALALKTAAQAHALYLGRDFVVPEDLFHQALPVLVHRLRLLRPPGDALEERSVVTAHLRSILEKVPSP